MLQQSFGAPRQSITWMALCRLGDYCPRQGLVAILSFRSSLAHHLASAPKLSAHAALPLRFICVNMVLCTSSLITVVPQFNMIAFGILSQEW